MKARVFALGFAAALCVLPVFAQDIPAGDDTWDSLGAGATEVTLSPEDWRNLCGASVSADTPVQLKGFNIAGQGTADTIVTRLDNASLPSVGSTASVRIQLKDLSLVSDGTNPCTSFGLSLRVSEFGTQAIDKMYITKTSSVGGTFVAKVPVKAIIESVDSSGNVQGTVVVSGSLGDDSANPWSYAPATSVATSAVNPPWHPGVDPVTKQPVRVCRRGNKILPARHCYWPPPKCKAVVKPAPAPTDAATQPVAVEPCYIDATPTNTRQ